MSVVAAVMTGPGVGAIATIQLLGAAAGDDPAKGLPEKGR